MENLYNFPSILQPTQNPSFKIVLKKKKRKKESNKLLMYVIV